MYLRVSHKVVLTWTGRWSIYCSVVRIFWLVVALCSCRFVLVYLILFVFVHVFGFVTGPWNNYIFNNIMKHF